MVLHLLGVATPLMIPIIVAAIAIMIVTVIMIISLRNYKQQITATYEEHAVEIVVQFSAVMLIIDGKTVDELRSYQMRTAKLQSTLDGKTVIVNIGSGFMRPKIITFIDGEKIAELSNC